MLSTLCIVRKTSYLYGYRPSSSYTDLPIYERYLVSGTAVQLLFMFCLMSVYEFCSFLNALCYYYNCKDLSDVVRRGNELLFRLCSIKLKVFCIFFFELLGYHTYYLSYLYLYDFMTMSLERLPKHMWRINVQLSMNQDIVNFKTLEKLLYRMSLHDFFNVQVTTW